MPGPTRRFSSPSGLIQQRIIQKKKETEGGGGPPDPGGGGSPIRPTGLLLVIRKA